MPEKFHEKWGLHYAITIREKVVLGITLTLIYVYKTKHIPDQIQLDLRSNKC